MDLFTLIGDYVIYFQITLLICFIVVSFYAINPLNRASVLIGICLLVSLILRTVLNIIRVMIIDVSFRTMRKFGDVYNFMSLSTSYYIDKMKHNGDKENLLSFLIIVVLITVTMYKMYLNMMRNRVIYIIPKYSETKDTTYSSERMVANSNFEVTNLLPSFQASIMGSIDGKQYHMVGQCFWVDEGIVTAAHVIEDYPYLSIYKTETQRIDIPSTRFEIGEGDYAVCKDVNDIVQKTGLAKAKLARLAIQKNSGISVNIVALNRRSIGFLNEYPQFGYLEYTGSTIKGFSGAPYYFGKTVFGMHLGSHSTNIGYDAAFLRSELKPSRVIKKELGLSNEDSAEWLEQQIDKYEDISWVRSPYNADEYKIKVGQQYHIVDSDVMDKLLRGRKSKQRAGKIDLIDESIKIRDELAKEEDPEKAMVKGLLSEFGRTSIVKESIDKVEDLPLAPRNAMTFKDSGNLIQAPVVNAGAHGMEYQQVGVQPQNMQISNQMGLPYQIPLVNYHMESRLPMHAPQNVVFDSTARNRRKRLRRQAQKSELKQYVQRYGPLTSGDATSQQPMTSTNGLI